MTAIGIGKMREPRSWFVQWGLLGLLGACAGRVETSSADPAGAGNFPGNDSGAAGSSAGGGAAGSSAGGGAAGSPAGNPTPDVTQLSLWSYTSCAVTASSDALCWGYRPYTLPPVIDPRPRRLDVDSVSEVVSSCALSTDGTVQCWRHGLGSATTDTGTVSWDELPVDVSGLTGIVQIVAGSSPQFWCAHDVAGSVWCWGDDRFGVCGAPQGNGWATVPVRIPIHDVISLAAGHDYACAIVRDGSLWCWGVDWYGELGDGGTGDAWGWRSDPVQVPIPNPVAQVGASDTYPCAVDQSGDLWCWGAQNVCESGGRDCAPTPLGGQMPTRVNVGKKLAQVSWGYVRTLEGEILCRGCSAVGVDGTTYEPILGMAPSRMLASANGEHACSLGTDRNVYCWGNNYFGQVGDGTTQNYRVEPVRVIW